MTENRVKQSLKYRVQLTTRNIEDHGVITLETKTVYEGADRDIAEIYFCSNDFSFGESATLLVFSNENNEDVLIRFYERTK